MPQRAPRIAIAVRILVVSYALLTALASGLLLTTADEGPLGMLLVFAPRWWLLWPWALLLPLAFLAGWRTVVTAALGALVTLFGAAQFELPARAPASASSRALRVVTYNTDLREAVAERIRSDLQQWDADVVLLQDCKTIAADSLRAVAATSLTRLTVHVQGRHCLVSKWPVRGMADVSQLVAPRSPQHTALRWGDSGVRFQLNTFMGDLVVYAVHLPSPRDALSTVRWLQTTDRHRISEALQRSITARANASAAIASLVQQETGPVIVAGDFNLPYGSAILRRDWSQYTNAFGRAGTGLGYTMQAGVFPVRIDHVLSSPGLVPVEARVLRGYPSEHQPLVVGLVRSVF
jgi:endonuclease/exonuclease/phosphatase (EEP) superfamily protein YafD